MSNQSGLKPLGRAVLVEPYVPERKKSMIELPDAVKENAAMIDVRAVVIEVGGSCWHDEPTPRAAAGDKVMVAKFSGFMAKGPADGKLYRLVNDRDIFCAITNEGESNG